MPWCLASAGMIAAADDKGTRSDVDAPVPAGFWACIKSDASIHALAVVALWMRKGWMERARGRQGRVDRIETGAGSVAIGCGPASQ
ncbi:hypothetical protein HDE77_003999 [Rhodanobacter sp. MP7CTX1]|nr:hypothetical protein [Rhodanobacter sp. MP7CTX1]